MQPQDSKATRVRDTSLAYHFFVKSENDRLLLDTVQNAHTLRDGDSEGMHNIFLKIEQLLKAGADPNAYADFDCQTSLHYTGLHWNERNESLYKNIVDQLLSFGASPNEFDLKGNSPLMLAVNSPNKNQNFIEKMIHAGVAVDKADSRGRTSLHYAAFLGRTDIVQILLAAGASPNSVDIRYKTPLLLAVENQKNGRERCLDIARQLIAAGADVNAACLKGITVLNRACLRKDEKIVSFLLSDASLVADTISKNGFNALMFGVESLNVKIVRMLMDKGFSVNYVVRKCVECKPRHPRTALQIAVLRNNVKMLEFLLENGANPNLTNGLCESTILFTSKMKSAHVNRMLELLLSHGADMYDGGLANPESPFEFLLCDNRVPEMRVLLKHGLNLDRYRPQTPDDFSPLHEAIKCSRDNSKMLRLLLEYNTRGSLDLEHLSAIQWHEYGKLVDEFHGSPLSAAALNDHGYADCIKVLHKSGADLNHLDSKGRTPLELAVQKVLKGGFFPLLVESIQYLLGTGAMLRNVLCEIVPDDSVDHIPESCGEYIHDDMTGELIFEYMDNGSESKRRRRLELAKGIVKFRVLFESLGPVEKSMEHGNMTESTRVRNHLKECKDEIKVLKNTPLYNSISYYDVLVGTNDFYKRVRNDQVYEIFTGNKLFDFPVYGWYLYDRCKKFTQMHKIWEKAVEKLSQYLKFDPDIHYEIIHNVLDHLHEDDWRTLAES